jgi:16S rRNA (adenine1518-N6/adenine1519-N6)-dimethyltransferase
VRLRFHPPTPKPGDRRGLETLVQAVFTRRRKTLENALLAYRPDSKVSLRRVLDTVGIDPLRRPETLGIPEFVRLSDAFGSAVL